jgi:hypothetical protein
MRVFQDTVTIYFRAKPEVEAEIVGEATRAFPYVIVADAFLASPDGVEPFKSIAVVSDRKFRRDTFDPFVQGVVEKLGKAGAKDVFMVINGVPAAYEAGKDYEQESSTDTNEASGRRP